MSKYGTIELLAWELSQAIKSIEPLVSSPVGFQEWMAELGWDVPLPNADKLGDVFGELTDLLGVMARIDPAASSDEQIDLYLDLIEKTTRFLPCISDVVSIFQGVTLPTGFKDEAPRQILDYIIISYLEYSHPAIHSLLHLFGAISLEETQNRTGRFDYVDQKLNLAQLTSLLSDPSGLFETLYGWGTQAFDVENLMDALAFFAHGLGIPAYDRIPDADIVRHFYDGVDPCQLADLTDLRIPFYAVADDEIGYGETGISVLPLVAQNATDGVHLAEGVAIQPYIEGSAQVELPLGGDFVLRFTGMIDASLLCEIRKGDLKITFLDEANVFTAFKGGIIISLIKTSSGEAMVLLGEAGGSRLEVEETAFNLGVLARDRDFELMVECELTGGKIIASAAGADGFLQKILPPDGFQAEFDFTIGWSTTDGLYFRGSAALEVTIPIHQSLGPLDLVSIYLRLGVGGDVALTVTIAVTAGVKIGPLAASVDRVGILIPIDFPQAGGNLGPLQLDKPRYKPPLGAGLVLDAGVVVGGGYLEIDTENERYAGILQLKIGEIALVAIGLITTRMPDGSRGFSMLVIIAVEFTPPITLPYNFTLSGVGGLIGIHRAMIIAAIQQGIKNRTIDSILFPSDPIKNASKIISDLRAVFPPSEGQFVLGPMVIIGWSTPNLVRAEIGILIQLPDPINIAVVGQLVSELPTKDMAVVELHVDVLGVIDPAKGTFAMDAVIYDSRILAFSLTGDMAMRLRWTQDPTLAISFGGLNPRFKMTNFPKLRRVTLSLGIGDNPRISLECYLALTSNTTQFGARLEVYASKGGFNIKGHLSFDTLIIFVPFSLTADIGGSVEVSKGKRSLLTANLDMTISGPTPWHARGKAKFKLVVVKLSVKFDKKWGRREKAKLPPANAWPLLEAALKEAGNWAGVPPAQAEMAVSLKPALGGDGELVLHPHGTLEIRQRVLPLNMKLEKFGNSSLSGESKFTISEVTIGGQSLSLAPVQDRFARAQFIKMSDKEALSLPSYEMLDAGVRAGSEKIACGPAQPCELVYETVVIDENKLGQWLGTNGIDWGRGRALHAQSASALAPVRRSGLGKYKKVSVTPKVTLQEEAYAIVSNKNLARCEQIGGNNGRLTYSQASQVLRDYLDGHPEEAAELQIVPECEVAL